MGRRDKTNYKGAGKKKWEKKLEPGCWRCPNPGCKAIAQGDVCTECDTSRQTVKDIEKMLTDREVAKQTEMFGGAGEEEIVGQEQRSGGGGRWRDIGGPGRRRVADTDGTITEMFEGFRELLDSRHDKAERVVKMSRDITIGSKRIIFILHRIKGKGNKQECLGEAEAKLSVVKKTWRRLARELKDEDHYQFLRNYTAGLQEWIEAIAFYHFLRYGKVISWKEIQEELTFPSEKPQKKHGDEEAVDGGAKAADDDDNKADADGGAKAADDDDNKADADVGAADMVSVPQTDFLMGLLDLTGEIMRNAINSIGSGNVSVCFDRLAVLQEMNAAFLSVQSDAPRYLNNKIEVFKQSLRKVEDACYTISVRGSEVPGPSLADFLNKPVAPTTDVFVGDEFIH